MLPMAVSSFLPVLPAGANVLVFPDRILERLIGHAVEAAICAAGLVASGLPGASRWANPLAVVLVLGINTSMLLLPPWPHLATTRMYNVSSKKVARQWRSRIIAPTMDAPTPSASPMVANTRRHSFG